MTNRYVTIQHLGEGQYANVYKAKDLKSGEIVAIKKTKPGSQIEKKDGISRSVLREIKLLKEVDHANIISLRDVFGHKSEIQLVFDFMDTDLEKVIKDQSIIFMPEQVKDITTQILKGLDFLHKHWILHRDMKPNNLLMDNKGRVKITDFGLARVFGYFPSSDTYSNLRKREYTNQVVTLWYRSPELLFGACHYGVGIDVWSVGCIIAELLIRRPMFQGMNVFDQLLKIFNVLGAPTQEIWPTMLSLKQYVTIRPSTSQPNLNLLFSAAPQNLIELMIKMWKFDPVKRITCSQALQMEYFDDQSNDFNENIGQIGNFLINHFQHPSDNHQFT